MTTTRGRVRNPSASPPTFPRRETTLVLAVAAGPGYTVGNPSAATVVLADRAFDLWRHQRFDAAALADPAVSGATAAPGGDDRSNLAVFFCGAGARGEGSDGSIVRRDGSLWFRFHRALAAGATPWHLESSRDLLTWRAWPPFSRAIPRQSSVHDGEWLELPLDQAPPGAGEDTWFRRRLTLPVTGG